MKKIPIKSGGHILIVENLSLCPEGERCFLQEEFDHAKRISAGYANDPDTQKAFWAGILERKASDSKYSIFTHFPVEVSATVEYKEINPKLRTCYEIIQSLKGGKP